MSRLLVLLLLAVAIIFYFTKLRSTNTSITEISLENYDFHVSGNFSSKCVNFPVEVPAGSSTFTIRAVDWTTSWEGYPAYATVRKVGASGNDFTSSQLTSSTTVTSSSDSDYVDAQATSPPFTVNDTYTLTFSGLTEIQETNSLEFCLSNDQNP